MGLRANQGEEVFGVLRSAISSMESCSSVPAVKSRTHRKAAKSAIAKPTESKRVISSAERRPGSSPVRTFQGAQPGSPLQPAGSPSIRVWGEIQRGGGIAHNLLIQLGLAGAVATTALRCTPGLTWWRARMVSCALSAVQVVMMSAPSTASSTGCKADAKPRAPCCGGTSPSLRDRYRR